MPRQLKPERPLTLIGYVNESELGVMETPPHFLLSSQMLPINVILLLQDNSPDTFRVKQVSTLLVAAARSATCSVAALPRSVGYLQAPCLLLKDDAPSQRQQLCLVWD